MTWLKLIPVIFQMGFKLLSIWTEFNSEKRKVKEEGFNEVKEGVKKRDPNLINSGFSRINRVR